MYWIDFKITRKFANPSILACVEYNEFSRLHELIEIM